MDDWRKSWEGSFPKKFSYLKVKARKMFGLLLLFYNYFPFYWIKSTLYLLSYLRFNVKIQYSKPYKRIFLYYLNSAVNHCNSDFFFLHESLCYQKWNKRKEGNKFLTPDNDFLLNLLIRFKFRVFHYCVFKL